jgi:hypothetical protein
VSDVDTDRLFAQAWWQYVDWSGMTGDEMEDQPLKHDLFKLALGRAFRNLYGEDGDA